MTDNPVDFLKGLDGQDGPCPKALSVDMATDMATDWCLPCYKLGLHRLHSLTLPLTCFLNFKNDWIKNRLQFSVLNPTIHHPPKHIFFGGWYNHKCWETCDGSLATWRRNPARARGINENSSGFIHLYSQ